MWRRFIRNSVASLAIIGCFMQFILRSHVVRLPADKYSIGTSNQKVCRKVLWFMGVSSNMIKEDLNYFKFVIAAINSAKANAPSLIPHVLYHGNLSNVPAALRNIPDITFINHELTFADHLTASVCPYGAFYRLDLPAVVEKLLPSLNSTLVDPEYALYTDTDVLFYQDFNECTVSKPKVMHIGPEVKKTLQGNSGVLYISIEALRKHIGAVIRLADRNQWSFPACDQGLITKYFRDGGLSTMLHPRFNWKGYWGGSVTTDNIVIAHFHGIKPDCLECLIANPNQTECFERSSHQKCHKSYQAFWKNTPDNGTLYSEMLEAYRKYSIPIVVNLKAYGFTLFWKTTHLSAKWLSFRSISQ